MARTRTGSSLRLAVMGMICGTGFVWGQQPAPAWGVDSLSTHVVTAWDMEVTSSDTQWGNFDGGRYLSGGSGDLMTGIHLPQGAQIVSLALDACDFSDTGQVQFILVRHFGGTFLGLASISTGTAAEPGCGRFTAALPTPATVDNDTYEYWLTGGNTPLVSTMTIFTIRVYYRLQVSPAPGAATFNDVPPTDPAFQFIEALAASGITAGCGSGNYCPNSPLTRRQMAVFLAKALGLHWPGAPPP